MYPCDLLFVHRDAERESIEQREKEIRESLEKSAMERTPPVVRVIPVRMQEAWLLVSLRQSGSGLRASGDCGSLVVRP